MSHRAVATPPFLLFSLCGASLSTSLPLLCCHVGDKGPTGLWQHLLLLLSYYAAHPFLHGDSDSVPFLNKPNDSWRHAMTLPGAKLRIWQTSSAALSGYYVSSGRLLLFARHTAVVAQLKTIRAKFFHRRILGLFPWGEVQRISSILQCKLHFHTRDLPGVFMSTILTFILRPSAFTTSLMAWK